MGAGGGRPAVGQIEVANIHCNLQTPGHLRAQPGHQHHRAGQRRQHRWALQQPQHRPAISGDGSTVAFFTLASTPGPGDTITCSINDQVNFTDHPDPVPDISIHSGQQPT